MNKEEIIKNEGLQRNIRVAIFGTGFLYQKHKDKLNNLDIVVLVDNDVQKHGSVIDGVKVVAPGELCQYNIDYVVIMSQYFDEMEAQLLSLGYQTEEIVTYSDLDFLNYCMEDRIEIKKWYLEQIEKNKNTEKKIVLLSPEMTLSGSVIILFYVAKILKENGFSVTVIAVKPDRLETHFDKEQILVGYDAYLKPYNKELWNFLDSFDYVWINTMLLQDIILGVPRLNKKCIWWIHESGKRCDTLRTSKLRDSLSTNLEIYGVGPCAINTMRDIWSDVEVKNLLYGIPDDGSMRNDVISSTNKVIFAIIGSIYDVKAQDIFLKAIEALPPYFRAQAEFWIVGRSLNESMLKEIQEAVAEYEDIKYLGELTREEMKEIYKTIDVLVCPSRRDTMPVVTMEAMMNCKPCIVSNVTGTAFYIEDGVNGYICEPNNVEHLSDKIVQAIENKNKLKEMGHLARNIYEREFSMETFERNLLKVFS